MKKKFITIYVLAALSLASTSCEDMVEVDPKSSLLSTKPLTDVQGYESLVVGVYDRLQSFNYWGRDMALLGDALSDNIFTVTTQASGRYTGVNRNTRNSHFNFWNTGYAAINEANNVLATIDGLTVPAAQEKTKKRVKGEALALRGMIYFDLARVYGYEPNQIQNGFNKSVVISLTPTLTPAQAEKQERSTVDEVYKQIELDLLASIELLPETGKTRLSQAAVHALLGKVYLYWGRNADAVTQFNLAISKSGLALASNYVTAFTSGTHPESFFEIAFDQATEMAGVTGVNESLFSYTQPNGLNARQVSTYGGQTPSDELLALFQEGDSRLGLFFESASSTSSGVKYKWANKYNSANGAYTDNVKVIRLADVLLMKAEALAKQGNYVDAAAIVLELRTKRNAGVALIPTDASLLTFIQQERRRELFFEGHRWFDLKRNGLPISKPAKTGVGLIEITDYRVLAPLPNAEIQLNPNLPQNPNY